jgi:hypothetical protein
MIRGKALVVGRMPVLRRDDQIEVALLLVGNRDNLVTVRHRQGSTGKKVVLNVD